MGERSRGPKVMGLWWKGSARGAAVQRGEDLVKWHIYGVLFPRNNRRRDVNPGGSLMDFPGNSRLPAEGFSGGWAENPKLRGW